MAYMNQQTKKELAVGIKAVLKKYKMKGTIAVRHHMVLVVNIKSGPLDIIGNWFNTARNDSYDKPEYMNVNHYWIHDHYTGEVKNFLTELYSAMKGDKWYDNSDIQTDYFDTAFYCDINVGNYNKPYELTA